MGFLGLLSGAREQIYRELISLFSALSFIFPCYSYYPNNANKPIAYCPVEVCLRVKHDTYQLAVLILFFLLVKP